MVKRLQNTVAESRLTLFVMSAYALSVWLAAGLVSNQWWVQFACFIVSTALIIELNNSNALIRIFSRMVSCSFLLLQCMAALFGSLSTSIVQLCLIATYITLFQTYQDKRAVGWTFYAFLIFSIASLTDIRVLYFVPVFWLLMATNLSSLSWRTFWASLIGLVTPYWFYASYLLFMGDIAVLTDRFAELGQFTFPVGYSSLSWPRLLSFAFLVVLTITGTIHFLRNSYQDKIRIRQLYGFFMVINFVTILMLILQPQHYNMLMGILVVNTSPLLAHFVSLTHTRVTNVAFLLIMLIAVALMILNIWGDRLIPLWS